jgi:hypothetical protein
MGDFVWTRMGSEGGQLPRKILELKEAERRVGNGQFWWGVGNSLGQRLKRSAEEAGGTLPVLISRMRSRAQDRDANPDVVFLWTEYWDDGIVRTIPKHVLEWSAGKEGKETHYALVCRSQNSLSLSHEASFDPAICTSSGVLWKNSPKNTWLLQGDLGAKEHQAGEYDLGFSAVLERPWQVRLVNPRPVSRVTITAW